MALHLLRKDRLFGQALAASLLIHLLFAMLFPALTAPNQAGLQPVETISFARLIRIEIAHHVARAAPAAPLRAHRRAPSPVAPRVRHELSARTHKPNPRPRPLPAAPPARVAAAPRRSAARHPSISSVRAHASAAPAPVQVAASSAAPAATTGPQMAGGAGSDYGGVEPFGARQDPVLDPRVIAKLQRRLSVHVTLVVTVGENGRTQSIAFHPPLDAQTEAAVQSILADAYWDAAVCGGGVSCQGTATIRL